MSDDLLRPHRSRAGAGVEPPDWARQEISRRRVDSVRPLGASDGPGCRIDPTLVAKVPVDNVVDQVGGGSS